MDVAPTEAVGKPAGSLRHELRLEVALGDVYGDRQPELARETRRRLEQIVRDRVWRVRRDADAHEWCLEVAQTGDLRSQSGNRFFASRRVWAEHFLIDDPANRRFAHRLQAGSGLRRVGKGRDSGAQSFLDVVA